MHSPVIYNEFVINPDAYWTPAYRISPFNTGFIKKNNQILKKGIVNQDLIEAFFGKNFVYCENGKTAIYLALTQYALKREDEVWVITTSGNKYISSCVTSEIEKFCSWSRIKTERTKLILVNHEFGSCYPELRNLKTHGLPIIEDRAQSFLSTDEAGLAGKVGDFVIYSLPKIFPINIGGILQINCKEYSFDVYQINSNFQYYLSVLISHYLKEVESIKEKRRNNFNYLKESFLQIGFEPRFSFSKEEVPGVFMFKTTQINLDLLKNFMQRNGVESSVFYGNEAFFIPVHQELEREDLFFLFNLVKYFVENGNK